MRLVEQEWPRSEVEAGKDVYEALPMMLVR